MLVEALMTAAVLSSTAWDTTAADSLAAAAEARVRTAFRTLWELKVQAGLADSAADPDRSGMMGVEHSTLTTTLGYEDAKELSTRPGWAAWLVKELIRRSVGPGSKVALSMTGSFPALNTAVLAALQEIQAEVHAISSVGASSYGANQVGWSWPEMESILRDRGVFAVGSGAVTLGGGGDRGSEWDAEAMAVALQAVARSRLPVIRGASLREAVRKRLDFYGDPKQYVCYINVGGNQASLGAGARIRFDRGGWFDSPPPGRSDVPGVMDAFLEVGVPCLNLLFLRELNRTSSIVPDESRP